MNNSIENEGVATCIFCGNPLKGHKIVQYRDWNVHEECANDAIETQASDFSKTPFYIGSISVFFGLLAATMFLQVLPTIEELTSPSSLIFGFTLMTAALLFQSFGFYGFSASFKDSSGIAGVIIVLLGSLFNITSALLLQIFGYDPAFYDPETGYLLLELVPGYYVSYSLAVSFVALTLTFTGILLLFYSDVIGEHSTTRVAAIIIIIFGMVSILNPIGYLIESIIVVLVFLSVEMPRDWRKMTDS